MALATAAAQPEQAAQSEPEQPERANRPWPAPGLGGWTVADLERLPDDGLRYEIVDGTLLVSPSPAPRHQWVSARLEQALVGACPAGLVMRHAPLDWAVDDTTVFQPDIMLTPKPPSVDAPVDRPVLVVEIASPSTALIDRTLKFSAYASAGVSQYWIVDPGTVDVEPSVAVYDLVDGAYVLQGSATGAESLIVTGPVPVTVTPAALLT